MPVKGQKKQPLSYSAWKNRLRLCRDTGWYTVFKCSTCGKEAYAVHHGCGLITCPTCAEDYARRLSARLSDTMRHYDSRKRPGWSLKVITLTLRKSGDMTSDIKRLQNCIKGLWARIGGAGRGLFVSIEVGKKCNVHAHCIYYGPYVPQGGLSELWQQLTGGSRVVWVEALRGKDINAAAVEASKYITKNLDAGSQEELYAVYRAFYGRRRILCYGVFVGLAQDELPPQPCPVCGCCEYEPSRNLTPDEYVAWKKGLDTS
jgi:hypothetical protein